MPADAIAHYHDLLAAGTAAADSKAELDRLQKLRGLLVGDRTVCSVLRPRFLTPDQYRFLRDRVAARPRIKAYLQSERRIPFNEEGIFRRYPELDG